jgi:hypothetical protein
VHLTTLGRLNAVREIVESYKHLTGRLEFDRCRASALQSLKGN